MMVGGLPLFIEGIFGSFIARSIMLREVCPYPPAQLLLDLISSARKFWQLFTIFFGQLFEVFRYPK
jgi:hypothetical protein